MFQCEDIHNATDKCTFAGTACDIDEGFINYIQAVYCKFPDILFVGVVLFVSILTVLLFYL